jgi:curved DNA-binding protein CbpA
MHSVRGVTETSFRGTRRRADARGEGAVGDDPFALLGLPTRPGLSDDDVRAGWRRIAAATHPDREDGGDPARFGAAAAAYAMLRTEFGRGEALADLGLSGTTGYRGRHADGRRHAADPSVQPAGRHRARRGMPVGRRTGVRLPELTRPRGWIARRNAPPGPADAANQDPTDAAARMSAGAAAREPGNAAAREPGNAAAREPGNAAAREPGNAAAREPGNGAASSPVDAGRRPWTRAAPDSRRSRLMENLGQEGSSRRRMQRDRWWVAGWSSRWRVATWRPDWRPVGSRLGRRPIRRPGGPALRVAAAAAMGVVAVVISGWSPGVVGVLVGVLTWLLVTAGHAFSRRR